MTPEKLLMLVQSWQEGDCPGEVLLDACMEMGIDVDSFTTGWPFMDGQRIRGHLLRCGRSSEDRRICCAARFLHNHCHALMEIRP